MVLLSLSLLVLTKFLISVIRSRTVSIVIVVVSLLTKKPDKEIEDEFEKAKNGEIEETEVVSAEA